MKKADSPPLDAAALGASPSASVPRAIAGAMPAAASPIRTAEAPADGFKPLSLALQGGGAHGAFTWGVLDRLLDEDDLRFDRISGSSAGALNGAAFASGYATGGREGARASMALLWRKIAEAGTLLTLFQLPLRKPGLGVWDDAMPLMSPWQTNPLAIEPLRYVLQSVVDLDALHSPEAPQLHVNAVNVQTGHSRVFGPRELSIETLMASACAPFLFQPVTIDGVGYWDGGYAGNPMLWPLFGASSEVDVLLVELTPVLRREPPISPRDIINRINEIASTAGLVAEMRAIGFMNELAARAPEAVGHTRVRMHVVSLPDVLPEAEPSTKRTIGVLFFQTLREAGRRACDAWLAEHKNSLGVRSTVDIGERYLAPHEQGTRGITPFEQLGGVREHAALEKTG